jgi:hypothetical protein
LASVSRNDRLHHIAPAIRGVHVSGPQRTPLQITELVEHEQRIDRSARAQIQFAVSEQSAVGGEWLPLEFQPQATVEINPQGAIIRFTR